MSFEKKGYNNSDDGMRMTEEPGEFLETKDGKEHPKSFEFGRKKKSYKSVVTDEPKEEDIKPHKKAKDPEPEADVGPPKEEEKPEEDSIKDLVKQFVFSQSTFDAGPDEKPNFPCSNKPQYVIDRQQSIIKQKGKAKKYFK